MLFPSSQPNGVLIRQALLNFLGKVSVCLTLTLFYILKSSIILNSILSYCIYPFSYTSIFCIIIYRPLLQVMYPDMNTKL